MSDVRVTSCFADFDRKQGFAGTAGTDTGFKLESNVLHKKYVELMGLSNCHLEISTILKFFKILKILKTFQNFQKISKKFSKKLKTGIYVKQICLMNNCAKCHVDIFKND